MSNVNDIKIHAFFAYLNIDSDYEIEELGEIIASSLFNNKYRFGGKDEYLRDEVPAIYFKEDFLGLIVFLEGYDGLYNFKIDTPYNDDVGEECILVDISQDFFIKINSLGNPRIKASIED